MYDIILANDKDLGCNGCNCEDEDILAYKCPGRYCKAETECESGFC